MWLPFTYTAEIKLSPVDLSAQYTLKIDYVQHGRERSNTLDLEDGVAFAALMSILSTGNAEMNPEDFRLRASG